MYAHTHTVLFLIFLAGDQELGSSNDAKGHVPASNSQSPKYHIPSNISKQQNIKNTSFLQICQFMLVNTISVSLVSAAVSGTLEVGSLFNSLIPNFGPKRNSKRAKEMEDM